jgi:hypothetical protein
MQTRLVNRLTACLKADYPGSLELFGKLHQKSSLLFLQAYSTPPAAASASLSQIQQLLQQARHPQATKAAIRVTEQVRQPQLQTDPATIRAKSHLLLDALVSQLLPLIEQITQYNKEISTLFDP